MRAFKRNLLLRRTRDDLIRINFSIITAWLVVAFFTKRAQVPFSSWLPAAIAAPTPVSSLVHSSTLVTAGVYMYVRILGNFQFTFVLWVGICTMVMAGLSALRESDIKKIVALSTLSQLGIIFISLGRGCKIVGFYHLLVHAYFKALLFIRVGNIIHLSDDYQDIRKMSSYEDKFSLRLSMCIFANLRLIGVPFIRGFLSKDLILERMLSSRSTGFLSFFIFFLGCILTRTYTIRFIFCTVLSLKKSQSFISKFKEDVPFLCGSAALWAIRVAGGSALGWVLFEGAEQLLIPPVYKKFLILIILIGIGVSLLFNSIHFNTYAWSGGALWSLPHISIRRPLVVGTPAVLALNNVVESLLIAYPWYRVAQVDSLILTSKSWKWETHFSSLLIGAFCLMWVYFA